MKRDSDSAPLVLTLLSLVVLAGCATRQSGAGEWHSLFNGRDLSGWTVKCQPQDQAKTFWKVDAGKIGRASCRERV